MTGQRYQPSRSLSFRHGIFMLHYLCRLPDPKKPAAATLYIVRIRYGFLVSGGPYNQL